MSSVELNLNIGQIKQDTALKEMNFGRFDGTPFDDVHQDKDIWSQLEKFWQNPVQHFGFGWNSQHFQDKSYFYHFFKYC